MSMKPAPILPTPKDNGKEYSPKDFEIDSGQDIFMVMYNVFNRLKKLQQLETTQLKIQENQQKLEITQLKIQDGQTKLLETILKTNKTIAEMQMFQTKLFKDILKTDETILGIQKMSIDGGKRLPIDNIVGSKKFLVIDIENDPGHPVKGFFIKNNGPYPIFVSDGENMVGPSIEDVKASKRFYKIDVDQEKERHINVPRITDIYIIQDPDIDTEETSSFTGELVW